MTRKGTCRVVVMWPDFGEYHVARLQSASRLCPELGVAGIETVGGHGSEQRLPFRTSRRSEVRIETLFPESDYADLSPALVQARVTQMLSRLDPAAVAVCGYAFCESRVAIGWCRREGRAAVLMSDSKRDDAPRWNHRELFKQRIVRLCDAALVAGAPHRDYIASLGMPHERIFEGYDAVGNDEFARVAEAVRHNGPLDVSRLGIGSNRFFLACNRFIARKNLAGLVAAYAKYRTVAGSGAWDLVLLGDGPDFESIRRQAADGRVDGVFLPGFRGIDELPLYYALAACFVHPALQDQWGLVVNEAMACGLPVLVSRTAGCRYDLVEEGLNGFTFDATSIDDMTSALLRMHYMPDECRIEMGHRSERIIARWGPDRFARGLQGTVEAGVGHARSRRRRLSLFDRLVLRPWL